MILVLMLLGHLVADYTLQGWLADGKQKSWWTKICGGEIPDKYKHDYIATVVVAGCLKALDDLDRSTKIERLERRVSELEALEMEESRK